MGRILLFAATVFTSAFLLFQVQPVIGRCILPWFGSTPGVWTTCMLFFQLLLLGGYAYAHLLVSRLRPARQAILHLVLLAAALVTLPITPSATFVPEDGEAPILGILLVLAMSVGLPYFVLSATGPLLQGWFARLHPGRSPYRLYALSNVGSLLALLSYPFVVEPAWGLSLQTHAWSGGFVAFALLCGACALALRRGRVAPAPEATAAVPAVTPGEVDRRPGAGDALLWFALSATASAMLLATTNQMCMDIAVVPFLWVAPLALYLLSFILTFDHARWYARPLFLGLLPVVLWWSFALLEEGADSDLGAQIIGFGATLFIVCMGCHGELARSKPAPAHLTWFFLVISIGGAAGGLLVALVAPFAFDDFREFPLLLVVSHGVILLAVFRNLAIEQTGPGPRPWWTALRIPALVAALVVGLFATVRMFEPQTWVSEAGSKREAVVAILERGRLWLWLPILGAPLVAELLRHLRRVSAQRWWGSLRVNGLVAAGIVAGLGIVASGAACAWVLRPPRATIIDHDRNFYGSLILEEWYRHGDRWDWTLRHGRITHGFQYRRESRRAWPTTYYGPHSGVGLAIRFHPERDAPTRPFRIGCVGLGAGTLAAYANTRIDPLVRWEDRADYVLARRRVPGDVVRYYEINPMVVDWAERHFTFLGDARERGADVAVFLGDARLVMQRQLEREAPQGFDVLAVDAFSSDAIPLHLLTVESFRIYKAHLAEGGALAIHVTNRFIDLVPPVRRLAAEVGLEVVHVPGYADGEFGVYTSDWLVLTDNAELLRELRLAEEPPPAEGAVADVLWTDDYSSVWAFVEREPPSWADVWRMLGLDDDEDRED